MVGALLGGICKRNLFSAIFFINNRTSPLRFVLSFQRPASSAYLMSIVWKIHCYVCRPTVSIRQVLFQHTSIPTHRHLMLMHQAGTHSPVNASLGSCIHYHNCTNCHDTSLITALPPLPHSSSRHPLSHHSSKIRHEWFSAPFPPNLPSDREQATRGTVQPI